METRYSPHITKDHELNLPAPALLLKARINTAWNDPRPSRPAGEVFDRIEAMHAKAIVSEKKSPFVRPAPEARGD